MAKFIYGTSIHLRLLKLTDFHVKSITRCHVSYARIKKKKKKKTFKMNIFFVLFLFLRSDLSHHFVPMGMVGHPGPSWPLAMVEQHPKASLGVAEQSPMTLILQCQKAKRLIFVLFCFKEFSKKTEVCY